MCACTNLHVFFLWIRGYVQEMGNCFFLKKIKKKPLNILRFEILAFPLHVMIVLKAQFECDEFTFVRIWAIHHHNHLVCFAPLIACTIVFAWFLLMLPNYMHIWKWFRQFCSFCPGVQKAKYGGFWCAIIFFYFITLFALF